MSFCVLGSFGKTLAAVQWCFTAFKRWNAPDHICYIIIKVSVTKTTNLFIINWRYRYM
jgi:hypothetical protein